MTVVKEYTGRSAVSDALARLRAPGGPGRARRDPRRSRRSRSGSSRRENRDDHRRPERLCARGSKRSPTRRDRSASSSRVSARGGRNPSAFPGSWRIPSFAAAPRTFRKEKRKSSRTCSAARATARYRASSPSAKRRSRTISGSSIGSSASRTGHSFSIISFRPDRRRPASRRPHPRMNRNGTLLPASHFFWNLLDFSTYYY